MLKHQRRLTLARPTVAPTATSSSRSAYFNTPLSVAGRGWVHDFHPDEPGKSMIDAVTVATRWGHERGAAVLLVAEDGFSKAAVSDPSCSRLLREMGITERADAESISSDARHIPQVGVSFAFPLVRAVAALLSAVSRGDGGAWADGFDHETLGNLVKVVDFLMIDGAAAQVFNAAVGLPTYPRTATTAADNETSGAKVAPPNMDVHAGPWVLGPGTQVTVTGLRSASEHNGHRAEVVALDEAAGRYTVRLPSGVKVRVKPQNLALPELDGERLLFQARTAAQMCTVYCETYARRHARGAHRTREESAHALAMCFTDDVEVARLTKCSTKLYTLVGDLAAGQTVASGIEQVIGELMCAPSGNGRHPFLPTTTARIESDDDTLPSFVLAWFLYTGGGAYSCRRLYACRL